MSAKKYPTPNLTAVEAKWYEMDAVHTYNARVRYAVQADIDLAVKSALAGQVYGPIRIKDGDFVDVIVRSPPTFAPDAKISIAIGDVPKQDKWCGTCAHVGNGTCAGMSCGGENSFKNWKARP